MGRFVKLGPKASFFRDSLMDISIAPNEVVELNVKQLNSRKVREALNGGHLVYTEKPGEAEKVEKKVSVEELLMDFTAMVKAGDKKSKISRTFNLEELKAMAKLVDIEVEATDTKDTIIEALMDDINESSAV